MMEFATCSSDPNFSGITEHLVAHRDFVGSNLQGLTMLPAKTLVQLLQEHGAPRAIEFMSIDTEGSEYEILRVFPFEQYKFAVIAVEHNFEVRVGEAGTGSSTAVPCSGVTTQLCRCTPAIVSICSWILRLHGCCCRSFGAICSSAHAAVFIARH